MYRHNRVHLKKTMEPNHNDVTEPINIMREDTNTALPHTVDSQNTDNTAEPVMI